MNLVTLIIQILLTIPLTIILNIFQNKENRRLNQIIIPTIYMILIAAFLPIVKENIFLIVIFEIFIRNFYITSVVNQEQKISNSMFILESLISIGLSLFTYNYFINQVNTVIPNPEEIKPFLWFLILLYMASLYKTLTKEKIILNKTKETKRKKEQSIMQYAKFKSQYSSIIKSKNELINNLTYAIMIFNDYKTPKLYRKIQSYIGALTKKETKYGIMQMKAYNYITDEESIKQAINNFEKQLKNTKLKENEQLEKILSNYPKEEKEEILTIYKEIISFNKI